MSNYKNLSNFGSNVNSEVNNPLTYCLSGPLDNGFLHGANSETYGLNSRPCQLYMSDYCAQNWDQFCEIASKSTDTTYPIYYSGSHNVFSRKLTPGEIFIYNTASKKYLHKMIGAVLKHEPFDPTVANSPMISYYVKDDKYNNPAVPVYTVDPKTIDNDVVMNKILDKPIIAPDILINIYNSMKRFDTLKLLKDTRLGKFYMNNPYFKDK